MLLFGREKYRIMKYTTKDIAVSVCIKKFLNLIPDTAGTDKTQTLSPLPLP